MGCRWRHANGHEHGESRIREWGHGRSNLRFPLWAVILECAPGSGEEGGFSPQTVPLRLCCSITNYEFYEIREVLPRGARNHVWDAAWPFDLFVQRFVIDGRFLFLSVYSISCGRYGWLPRRKKIKKWLPSFHWLITQTRRS
jgi:hypothetical protein